MLPWGTGQVIVLCFGESALGLGVGTPESGEYWPVQGKPAGAAVRAARYSKNNYIRHTLLWLLVVLLFFTLGYQLYYGAVIPRIAIQVLQMEISQCLPVARTCVVEHPGMPQWEIILPSQQSLSYALNSEKKIKYWTHKLCHLLCAPSETRFLGKNSLWLMHLCKVAN